MSQAGAAPGAHPDMEQGRPVRAGRAAARTPEGSHVFSREVGAARPTAVRRTPIGCSPAEGAAGTLGKHRPPPRDVRLYTRRAERLKSSTWAPTAMAVKNSISPARFTGPWWLNQPTA